MNEQKTEDKIYTTNVLHGSCEEDLQAKCQWEHMSRMAVLRGWKDVVCLECQRHVRTKDAQND